MKRILVLACVLALHGCGNNVTAPTDGDGESNGRLEFNGTPYEEPEGGDPEEIIIRSRNMNGWPDEDPDGIVNGWPEEPHW